MSTGKSINVRIPIELHEIIVETMEKLNPVQQKLTGEDIGYMGAARMIALKLKRYTLPFTEEVYQELFKIAKENGGKNIGKP